MKLIKNFIYCLLLLGFSLTLMSCAKTQPILNLYDQPASQNLTQSQVQKCIELAGTQRGWIMEETKPGLISGSIERNGHYARIKIPYSNKGYSINYDTSTNFMVSGDTIHRNYNKWIKILNQGIQENMRKENEKILLKQSS